jgi:hypothetical protein
MEKRKVAIRFPESNLADAGQAAKTLRDQILDDVADAQVEIEKDDQTTQDFGATLIAVFGSQAIIVLAQGIANWMMRRGQTVELEIDGKSVKFRSTGSVDETAARIVEALSQRNK